MTEPNAAAPLNLQIQRGPCMVCGARDYPLSVGGPGICPACDCGQSPTMTVAYSELVARLAAAEQERELILTEARVWAMEAKTQRHTVNEVGAVLGGMADWQGIAKAVRERIEAAEREAREATTVLKAWHSLFGTTQLTHAVAARDAALTRAAAAEREAREAKDALAIMEASRNDYSTRHAELAHKVASELLVGAVGPESIFQTIDRAAATRDAALARVALMREALEKVEIWWGTSWDCSASPGHEGYPIEVSQALAASPDTALADLKARIAADVLAPLTALVDDRRRYYASIGKHLAPEGQSAEHEMERFAAALRRAGDAHAE